MRPTSRPVTRWIAAGLTVTSSAWACLPATAATPVLENPAFTYQTPQGENFFAVSLRARNLAGAIQPANRHVVLLDTSASQAGVYRDRSWDALQSMLKALPKQSTVAVYAIDVAAQPLTAGFLSPEEALRQVEPALADRAPLGATDLSRGLEEALGAFGKEKAGSVIYIGDGMSAANLLRTGELETIVGKLHSRRIPVHSLAIGPDTDWRLLGVLAHQTGGVVQRDAEEVTPAKLGEQIAAATTLPIVFPETMGVDESGELLIGKTAPPLRSDRDTIILGRGELPSTVQVTSQGTAAKIAVDAKHAVADFPAVRSLALAAERSNGLDMPAAGSDLLAAVDGLVANQVDQLALAGRLALENQDRDAASRALDALVLADPAGAETTRLVAALNQAPEEEIVPPAPAVPLGDNLIEAEMERQRILTQQLNIETNSVIDRARQIRGTSPSEALNLLKRQESQIEASVEIEAESRRQLLRRLNNEIVVTSNMEEKQQTDFLLQQERLAQIEAQQRVVDRMVANEEELEQLIARVRALMYEGYHGDDAAFEEARVVGQHAINLRPGNGPAMAALFTATAADQLNKVYRLRALRNDRFLETLYQVELSHVPFPDEPPVVYPAPEVWWALTERRKKYEAVSLDTPSPAELQIRNELDKPTRLEYSGIPLRDAIGNLATQHGINVVFLSQDIEEEGLSVDNNVDLFLNGVTLRSALKLMLEPEGLTYAIEDEVLKITTQTAAEQMLSLRVYPVADLVIPIQQLGGMGGMGAMGSGMGGMGGGMGAGMGGMGGGMGGMGGGMGGMGGGMGGGFMSVPAPQAPRAQGPRPQAKPVPQANDLAAPIDDAEMRHLLETVTGEQAAIEPSIAPIAFASIRDEVGERASKKK